MTLKTSFLCCLAALLVSGCSDDSASGSGADSGSSDQAVAEAVATYAQLVHATYADSLTGAKDLDTAVQAFLDDPSEAGLKAARDAWLAAREPYLLTEAYRFYDGPIDNPQDGPEGFMNAWPLDENYIDYVAGNDGAGIINDDSQEISKQALMDLNEAGGEANIATGYHTIEFLLWGQDMSETGPGARAHTDYLDDGTAANQDRRRQYLGVVSELLVEHLQSMVDAWAPDADNYRSEMEAADSSEGLRRILTGLIILSGFETGGERLQTALDTGDQEDEHSCFSDNTHRDMVQDVQGIQNVFMGSYKRLDGSSVSGPSVRDAVESVDKELATKVADRIAESLSLAEALQTPFDREIAAGNDEGRSRVEALINSLGEQETVLFDVFTAFDLSVEIPGA